MKKLGVLLIFAMAVSLGACGGGSSKSDPEAVAQLYNRLVYTNGQKFTLQMSISDIKIWSYTGVWGEKASTTACGDGYTVVISDSDSGRVFATGDNIQLECDKLNMYTVGLSNGRVALWRETADL